MKNWKLSHKLIAAFLAIGIIPAITVTWMSLQKGNDAVETKAYEILKSNRENKKAQISGYFAFIRGQISTFSSDVMIIEAAKEFKHAYHHFETESEIAPQQLKAMREDVRSYYQNQFLAKYRSKNKNNSTNINRLIDGLDNTSLALQHAYISANQYELGNKDGLERAAGKASYHAVHVRYHKSIRHYLNEFGYYDIFIVDPESGNIIYSVYKELDFATSLKTGPYANTNFAEAFKAATRLHDPNATFLVDFEQYTPSYEAPASFISSPIYDGDTLVGVLVFQMPIDRMIAIAGLRAGLGESGETYMVGKDNLMRSDMYSDSEHHSVEASFKDPQKGSLKTAATDLALSGKTGEMHLLRNEREVLSAFTPIDLGDGIQWALIAEIDEQEALAAIPVMRNQALAITGLLALLTVGAAVWFASSITAPLRRIFKGLKRFSTQELNAMGRTFQTIGRDISLATDHISSMSNHISEASTNQAASLEETSASMEEISSVTQQNSENAQQSSKLSTAAQESVQEGSRAMTEMSAVMDKIQSSSKQIASILKIIDDISFQTNILALNAAVEAARAGESGAGFAVVADEVRQLAQRTADASKDTAKLINESVSNAEGGVAAGDRLSKILQTIEKNVSEAAELAGTVSCASLEQTEGINQINSALNQLDSSTQRNAAESQELAAQSVQLSKVVTNLDAIIGTAHQGKQADYPASGLNGNWHGKQEPQPSSAAGFNEFSFTDEGEGSFQTLHDVGSR